MKDKKNKFDNLCRNSPVADVLFDIEYVIDEHITTPLFIYAYDILNPTLDYRGEINRQVEHSYAK